MCMGNKWTAEVRQGLLPAARDFLLVPARAHPPSSSDAPFPPLQTANDQLLRSGRVLKTSQNVDRRAVGCNLVVPKSALSQSPVKSSSTDSCHALRATQLCFCLSERCGAFFFFLNGASRNSALPRTRAALQPQEPRSSGPWTPGAPAEVLTSRGVAGSWQAAGAIFAVGKAVLTLHPPLAPGAS
jgi:hypothetical protein